MKIVGRTISRWSILAAESPTDLKSERIQIVQATRTLKSETNECAFIRVLLQMIICA